MLRRSSWAAIAAACLLTGSASAAGRVDLDVRYDTSVPPGDLQRWSAMLGQAGFDSVRLVGSATAGAATVEAFDGVGGKSYKVSGVLARGGMLLLPSGQFGLSDAGAVAIWVNKLRTEGPPLKPGEKRPPFGLPPDKLDAVRRDLAQPADFSTKDRMPVDIVNDLANRVGNRITADGTIAAELGRAEKVPGELKGLSCGTVAAAVLRREGLSLVPTKVESGAIEYQIVHAKKDQDVWPVGWESERPLMELLPEYFKPRSVKIDNYKATELFQVIADRLQLPMLFDEQELVLKNLDPSKMTVNIPEGQLAYGTVLDRAMYQSSLKHEVRFDDSGRPFLWVTSR